MKPGKIIVMYNGKGKSYITKAFTEYFWESNCTPEMFLWEENRKKWDEKKIKKDLKLGDSFIHHSERTDLKEIKKVLGIALSRRSYFIDMSYNK